MSVMPKRLGKGYLDSVYTIISSEIKPNHIYFIDCITFCNTSSVKQKIWVKLADIPIIHAYEIPPIGAENTLVIPFMDQIIHSGEFLLAKADDPDAVSFYISGKEQGFSTLCDSGN